MGCVLAQNHVLSLDGDGDYVALPQAIIDGDEFAIEAWFFLLGDGGGMDQQNMIFAQRTNATECYHSAVILVAKSLPELPNCSFTVRTDQDCSENTNSPYPGTGLWHHVVGVKENQMIHLYVDGELVSSSPYTQTGSFASNIDYVDIGRHRHTSQNHGYFFGLIDELRIWDYALNQNEIGSRMYEELQGNEQGLLAYWNFEDSEDQVVDQSGNGHNGSYMGGAHVLEAQLPTPIGFDMLGDFNQDGQLNISDIIQLVNYILDN